jgi:hypothetical protein
MVINRNLTNEEILANDSIREKIYNGEIVVIDKVQTSNPNYVNLYFIGLVDGLATGTTQVSKLASQLLGWDNSGIPFRAVQNARKSIADGIPIGHGIKGCIRVLDSIEPFFEGQEPRQDRKGRVLYHGGKPVYRIGTICSHEEFKAQGHQLLQAEKMADESATSQPAEPMIGTAKSSLLG